MAFSVDVGNPLIIYYSPRTRTHTPLDKAEQRSARTRRFTTNDFLRLLHTIVHISPEKRRPILLFDFFFNRLHFWYEENTFLSMKFVHFTFFLNVLLIHTNKQFDSLRTPELLKVLKNLELPWNYCTYEFLKRIEKDAINSLLWKKTNLRQNWEKTELQFSLPTVVIFYFRSMPVHNEIRQQTRVWRKDTRSIDDGIAIGPKNEAG